MRYSFSPDTEPACEDLARALIRAWLLGDAGRFHLEIERASAVDLELEDNEERERRELLQSIAQRLKRCPDPFADRAADPGLDLCINLLTNFIARVALQDTLAPARVPIRSARPVALRCELVRR